MSTYNFPENFYWGTATASYQIEGAYQQDGRGESIWDRFCQTPGNILHGDTGEEACDHYNRFREDVKLMKELGYKAYRFSISWSRVLPNGTGEINQKGLQFYSDLVDELLEAGIEPFLTIFHWDLPQKLQDRGGWQNEECIQWFTEYCKVLYEHFNGRVKHWMTFNEPYSNIWGGYHMGVCAPGIRDLGAALLVSWNLLRAHGEAVRLFRKMGIEGEIGIVLNHVPTYPASDSPEDLKAARIMDGYGNRWFFDPIFKGKFPEDMIELFHSSGVTMPDFSDASSISEPLDFLGLNYYMPNWVTYAPGELWPLNAKNSYKAEVPHTDRDWPVSADAFYDLLLYLKSEYHIDNILIAENGACYNDVIFHDGKIRDYQRIEYLRNHLLSLHRAISAGVHVSGYFVWSFIDNFEWTVGYSGRFGLVYEDFQTHIRTPKMSAYWYKDVIENNGLD